MLDHPQIFLCEYMVRKKGTVYFCAVRKLDVSLLVSQIVYSYYQLPHPAAICFN